MKNLSTRFPLVALVLLVLDLDEASWAPSDKGAVEVWDCAVTVVSISVPVLWPLASDSDPGSFESAPPVGSSGIDESRGESGERGIERGDNMMLDAFVSATAHLRVKLNG